MTDLSSLQELRIIGVDCATDAKNVGLALCTLRGGHPRLDELRIGNTWSSVDEHVAKWSTGTTLLALDAPLGWPAPLADLLPSHRAGATLPPAANALFRRATDDVVADHLGKRPLDVGADRIARTAHAALSLLARLRARTNTPVPLAWEPGSIEGVSAIEVYPAGTLAARGLPSSAYKGSDDRASTLRRRLTNAVRREVSVETPEANLMIRSDHALDAALCVCAGLDFLSGDVVRPGDWKLAKREGWIWVRRTS